MDFNTRLKNIEAYITKYSDISTDVDVEYAQKLDAKIINTERPVSGVNLFANKDNSDLALAILDA